MNYVVMNRILEYKLVKSEFVNDLGNLMVEAIKDGWQPFGSPFTRGAGYIYQAVVKYEK